MVPGTRRGTDADAAEAAEVYLRARHAAVPAVPRLVHTNEDVRRWFREVVVAERELWVAEDVEAGVVALLVLHGDWLDQLYVEPGLTGRGIGAALVEVAKRERPAGLRLWAFQSNRRALRFYEVHGFVEVERTDGAGNEEGAPDVRLVWRPGDTSSVVPTDPAGFRGAEEAGWPSRSRSPTTGPGRPSRSPS